VRKIVSLAKCCSIDADDVREQTQINISKETLEREKRANKSIEDQSKILAMSNRVLFFLSTTHFVAVCREKRTHT
jgi:hypothetical protein